MIDDLRAEAERSLAGITPGEWQAADSCSVTINDVPRVTPDHVAIRDVNEAGLRRTRFVLSCNGALRESAGNAHFAAAAPRLIRRLLDALTAAEQEIARLRKLLVLTDAHATQETEQS